MRIYIKPQIEIVEAKAELLTMSGPDATSIGSPDVENEAKSIWDEVNEQYNIKEEQNNGED